MCQPKKVFLVIKFCLACIACCCVAVAVIFGLDLSSLAKGGQCSQERIFQARSRAEVLRVPKDCQCPSLFHAFGIKLIRAGKNQEALPWIRRAVKMAPDKPDYFEDYIVLLVWLGRYDKAIDLFGEMPSTFPRRPYLLRNVAMAAARTKRFELASRLYGETLGKDPKDKEAFEGLYNSLMSLGRYKEVDGLLERYGKGGPIASVNVSLLRFRLYLKEDRPMSAFREWKAAADSSCSCYFRQWKDYLGLLGPDKAEDISGELERLHAPLWDVFLPFAATRQYKKALEVIKGGKGSIHYEKWPVYYLPELAWVFFKNDDVDQAMKLYQFVLHCRTGNREAMVGMVYCLCEKGKYSDAEKYLHVLTRRFPHDIDVLFATAFFFERKGRFLKAIEVYDKILRLYRGNEWAKEARIRTYSRFGVPSFAMELAKAEGTGHSVLEDLDLDEAALFQHWGLVKEAEKIYDKELRANPRNRRARLDYLIDLRQEKRFPEVMKLCQALFSESGGGGLPYWAKSPCADTYLYYDKPETALKIYNEILEAKPDDFNAALGRLYCLTALRRWDEAERLGKRLFDKESPGKMIGKKFYPNWSKLAAAMARGYLIAETRPLYEAEDYFLGLKFKAPADSGIGAVLGDVYFWRGWPRKALQELTIAAHKDPGEKDARVSMAYVMDNLGYEKRARDLNSQLLKKYPYDKHVINEKRLFHAEDMREFVLDFSNDNEDSHSTSFDLRAETNEKPYLNWRVYQYFLWQYSSFGKRSGSFQRIGTGLRHRFGPSLYWQQEISMGIDGEKNFGIGSSLSWTPDDFWNLSGYYNTYSTQTPLRARAAGIHSDEASVGLAYHFSEWRAIRANVGLMTFSDDNDRLSASVSFRQGMWKRGDWFSEVTVENYVSFNSKDPRKVNYWNPRADWSCTLTHKLQYTEWRSFDQAIIHSLFLESGSYYQRNYGTKFIGSATYEIDRQASLRTHIVFRAGVARRVYDGDVTTALNFTLHLSYRF